MNRTTKWMQRPNDKHKRIRKRIALKSNSQPKSTNEGSKTPIQKGEDAKSLFFNYPIESNTRQEYKSYKPQEKFGFKERKPQGRFNDRNKVFKPFDDPTAKHKIFNKHTNNKSNSPKETEKNHTEKQDELVRLNKYISNAGICSRREADDLIAKGLIKVNGQVANELGLRININDKVEYRGKIIAETGHVYLLLNKPKDTISTTSDPSNRATVMDLVRNATDKRIFPIGRLDRNTTGIILFTNDGDFAQKLSHPSSELKKVYYAILDKPLEKEHYDQIVEGLQLEDGLMQVDEIAYVDDRDLSLIGIEIHSGKNRIIHRLFEHLGYRVRKLDRVVYAGLDKGGLRRGKWRFLRFDEVQTVLNSIKYTDESQV